ncbi:hypothetical protein ADK88_21295, partial [Streptomyces sp. NRRL F-2295]|uniref:hypothetical protein n=1 Tax=Streptomyces sp. NRRL F-2295 TaxID=1519477 RepID=UPI0006C3A16E
MSGERVHPRRHLAVRQLNAFEGQRGRRGVRRDPGREQLGERQAVARLVGRRGPRPLLQHPAVLGGRQHVDCRHPAVHIREQPLQHAD